MKIDRISKIGYYTGMIKKIILILTYSILFVSCAKEESVAFERKPESRKRIAVLDSGINRDQMLESFMCNDIRIKNYGRYPAYNRNGHGSNVVGLIAERMDKTKYCITVYNIHEGANLMQYLHALAAIKADNPVGLNISLASDVYVQSEEQLLMDLVDRGVKVFVAAGNLKQDLNQKCDVYPACNKILIPKIKIVGSSTGSYSNHGQIVDIWEDGTNKGVPAMSGSSQATAIVTGKYFSK